VKRRLAWPFLRGLDSTPLGTAGWCGCPAPPWPPDITGVSRRQSTDLLARQRLEP